MDEKKLILLVEDEPSVLALNARRLRRKGYDVEEVDNAEKAYGYLENHIPDLLILDVLLPDGNGFDICRYFRKLSENPVLFLTGKANVADKIEGLGSGCDYYLTKPYSMEEMLAVVERMLSRTSKILENQQQSILKKGSLVLNLQEGTVCCQNEVVLLTSIEFRLMSVFMQHVGQCFTAEELYRQVWKTDMVHDVRTIRTHILHLRNKIRAGDTDEYDITSIYGKGYVFQ